LVDIRGNVDTRLAKVDEGEYDAVVLAAAGLCRLGRAERITQRLSLEEMVPAPGQAALAVEGLADGDALELAAVLDHPPTRAAVELERSLLEVTAAGCRSALGAFAATGPKSHLILTAFVEDGAGPRRATVEGSNPMLTIAGIREALEI
jgi:hydroxymethylbilane synthase